MMRLRLVHAAALVIAAALGACDVGGMASRPAAGCAEPGAQCALPEGPLGVCERAPCAGGATPPCFACTPQH